MFMLRSTILRLSGAVLLIFTTLFISSCDEAGWSPVAIDDDEDETTDNRRFFGPGSVWELTLDDDDSFALTRKTAIDSESAELEILGTYNILDSGFTRLTVSEPAVNVPTTIAALDIADYAVLLMPPESTNNQLVATITSGTCSSASVSGNWIQYKFSSTADTSADDQYFFGTWRYDPAIDFFHTYDEYNVGEFVKNSAGGGSATSEGCDEGLASNETDSQFVSANASIVSIDEDDSQINTFRFGLPEDRIVSAANFDGDYVGFMYDTDSDSSGTIAASCNAGECELYSVSDIANVEREEANKTHTLALGETPDLPEDGFITGTLTDLIDDSDNNPGNIACMVNMDINNSEKHLLSCVGQYPSEATGEAVNIFLYSDT